MVEKPLCTNYRDCHNLIETANAQTAILYVAFNNEFRAANYDLKQRVSEGQIGQLEPVITLNSGFLILPFVSVVDMIPPLEANAEVENIFHIPLEPFLKTMANDPDPTHNLIQEMYVFEYQGQTVWGASARVLKQIADCLKS